MLRAILLYLLLVGTPVLGILGLLRVGQSLTPPISMRGTWTVQLSLQTADSTSCASAVSGSDQAVLAISQSGPQLQLILKGKEWIALAGEIHDTTVTAEGPSASAGAGASSSIHLNARVDRQAKPNRLLGQITFPNCPSHIAMAFTATRQPESEGQ